MSDTQWLNGAPSFSVTLTPAEAMETVRGAVTAAAFAAEQDSAERVKLSLALAWLEWKVSA